MVSANGSSENLSAATALERGRWVRALKEHATFGPMHAVNDRNGLTFLDNNDQIPLLGFVQNALMVIIRFNKFE